MIHNKFALLFGIFLFAAGSLGAETGEWRSERIGEIEYIDFFGSMEEEPHLPEIYRPSVRNIDGQLRLVRLLGYQASRPTEFDTTRGLPIFGYFRLDWLELDDEGNWRTGPVFTHYSQDLRAPMVLETGVEARARSLRRRFLVPRPPDGTCGT